MSSRRSKDTDSLDMLLDTITNTFGGIVFLAMLIVLLMGSAKPVTSVSQDLSELEEIKEQIENLSLKKEVITQAQTAQKIVSSLINVDSDPVALANAKRLAAQYSELRDRLSNLMDTRVDVSEQLRQAALAESRLNQEIESNAKTQAKLADDLEREIKDRSREVSLPKERLTQKSQSVALVKFGRLYLVDRSFGFGGFEIDLRNFEKCKEADAAIVLTTGSYRPKASSGIPIDDSNAIRNALQPIDKGDQYLTLAIWGDSFEKFSFLRKTCEEINMEYELILMKPDGKIAEGARNNAPKVQ